ncbi:MAG TPA: hypothetical protein VH142_16515 [Polyangiaceae bacterium]|nr:hypothetical protein [Polyangiaceae bacterium]
MGAPRRQRFRTRRASIEHHFAHTTRAAAIARVVSIACAACTGCSNSNLGDGAGYLGGEAGVASCPHYAERCDGPAPTYATDVAPIFDAHCAGCHNPAGEYPTVRFDSYAAITNPADEQAVTSAPGLVHQCRMPPEPLPAVPIAEANVVDCWFATGMLP